MDYRKEFPIFKNRDSHYLDTAATSQKPKRVLDKIMEYYEKYNGNVYCEDRYGNREF